MANDEKLNFENINIKYRKVKKRGGRLGGAKIQVKILSKNSQKIINLNRRRAIREHCLNCSGYSRAEVHRCPVTSCPLSIIDQEKENRMQKHEIRQSENIVCGAAQNNASRC